jgi:hypothetical protein
MRSARRFSRSVCAVAATTSLVGAMAFGTSPARAATDTNVAAQATVTASSSFTGYSPAAVTDGVIAGYPDDPGAEWASNGEGAGAWIQLSWGSAVSLDKVDLYDRPNGNDQVTAGTLTFSDGSHIDVGTLPNDASSPAELTFTPVSVTWVRFTVTAVTTGTANVGLAEFQAWSPAGSPPPPSGNTNLAPESAATASSSGSGTSPDALTDGTIYGNGINDWISNNETTGAWAQLTWTGPVRLDQIDLYDRSDSNDEITAGTLSFSDGSQVNVGALPNDTATPGQVTPGEVTFSSKTVTWVKFTVTAVSAGATAVGLDEFQAYGGGCPGPEYQVCVVSPEYGADINGNVTIQLYAPGMVNIEGHAWHQPDATHTDPNGYDDMFGRVYPPDQNGFGELTFPAGEFPAGPITIELEAWNSAPGDNNYTHSDTAYVQLNNTGGVSWDAGIPGTTPPPASGMSVAYQDDFTGPLSISQTGAGATYAACQPETGNFCGEFGDGIFADPNGPDNPFATLDNQYLRIRSTETPAGHADPQGWGRTHFGGMLSSVHTDGTGVAVANGYYEARMMSPAGPGTWPGFWLVSQNSVSQDLPTASEIDAVEEYGHDPTTSCQSAHEWGTSPEVHVGDCAINSPAHFAFGDMASTWHTYGVKVTSTTITYYVDDTEVWSTPTPNAQANTPLFFMIDLALGGGWPKNIARYNNQVDLYVDYVRIFH